MIIWMAVAIFVHNEKHEAEYDHGDSKHHVAIAMGISALYLLTQTATTFFARYDYTPADRTRVPALITATLEFAELCPANATCMSKSL